MRFYIAANYAYDIPRAKEIASVLEHLGHTITHKWWDFPGQGFLDVAQNDIAGVRAADVTIAVMEQERAWKGLWVEIGAALAMQRHVITLGGGGESCVFYYHPNVVHVASLPDLLTVVDAICESRV